MPKFTVSDACSGAFDAEILEAIVRLPPVDVSHLTNRQLSIPRLLYKRIITEKVYDEYNVYGAAIPVMRKTAAALNAALDNPDEQFEYSMRNILIDMCVRNCEDLRLVSEPIGRSGNDFWQKSPHETDNNITMSCMAAAAWLGSVELFEHFRMQIDIPTGNSIGWLGTPGWAAIENCMIHMEIHMLRTEFEDGWNELTNWADNLFEGACMTNDVEIARTLLDMNFEFAIHHDGWGLNRAVRECHYEVLGAVIDHDSNHKLLMPIEDFVVDKFSESHSEPMLRFLYERCAKKKCLPSGRELLTSAIAAKQEQNLQLLLDLGQNPNQKWRSEKELNNPLGYATAFGTANMIRILVASGAVVPEDEDTRCDLRRVAVWYSQIDTLIVLEEFGIEKPAVFDDLVKKAAKKAARG